VIKYYVPIVCVIILRNIPASNDNIMNKESKWSDRASCCFKLLSYTDGCWTCVRSV